MKEPAAGPEPGKVIVVTGASRGIGRALALRLAGAGYRLALTARESGDFTETLSVVRAACTADNGAGVEAFVGDITDEAFVGRLFEGAVGKFGRIDGLVNNAGVAPYGPIQVMSVSAFRDCIEINLVAAYACMRQAILQMKRQDDRGKIINVGSVRSHWALFGDFGAYPAAKYGLRGLTEAVARQLHSEKSKIAIGLLCPGKTDTRLTNPNHTPMDDAMDPDTVARAAQYMLEAPDDVNIYDLTLFPMAMHPW